MNKPMVCYLELNGVRELYSLDIILKEDKVIDRTWFPWKQPPRSFLQGVKTVAIDRAREQFGADAEIEARFNPVQEKVDFSQVLEKDDGQIFYKGYLIAGIVNRAKAL